MHTSGRGEGALRRYRVSIPGHTYFLTLCTDKRVAGLNAPDVATTLHSEITAIEVDGHWKVRGGVTMPDHVHLLVRISGTLPLSRCIARLKTKTKAALATRPQLSWQANFFEHRLRPDESIEAVLRYLFLNPHRAGIVPINGSYPWFWLGVEEAAWFSADATTCLPLPEWLQKGPPSPSDFRP